MSLYACTYNYLIHVCTCGHTYTRTHTEVTPIIINTPACTCRNTHTFGNVNTHTHTLTHVGVRGGRPERERQRSHTLLQLKHGLWFQWSLQTETNSTIFTEKLFLASFCFFSGGGSVLATQRLWELQLWVNTKNNMLSVLIHSQLDWPVCGSMPAADDRPQVHRLLEFWEISRQWGVVLSSVRAANDRLSHANTRTDSSARGPQEPEQGPAVTHFERQTELLLQPGLV